ncbi:RsmE family RNA methyltransferase [Oleiharenicola lentus]|uniref:RsmE family RNA methyltransferase n=1 Tax=Oleiharenicola lentus TaxID=2508720 RepID=UPI003F672430
MSDFRVFCLPAEPNPSEIRLAPAESHHLVVVNRCLQGSTVVAFDGKGGEWITECVRADKHSALLRVRESKQAAPLPHVITLAQSLPKGGTMDDIVRQATEVGAAKIIPLISERTEVHLEADRAEKKIEKWRIGAVEAAKQCGNPWLPDITPLQKFSELITHSGHGYDLKLIASLHRNTKTLKAALAGYRQQHGTSPRNVLWLVGPEGDFSPAEIGAALDADFQPITLGPLVLRSDTAALYALSILSYELQNA